MTPSLAERTQTYLKAGSTVVIVLELAQAATTGQDLALDDHLFVADLLRGVHSLLDGVGRNAEGNVDAHLRHDFRGLVFMQVQIADSSDSRGGGPPQDGGGGGALEEGGGCRGEHH